ncbi:MAG: hypothetical protein K2L64_01930, partial [Ureaplasma sp.]|nr:hypothetical protein [Ureaplasma sp.]
MKLKSKLSLILGSVILASLPVILLASCTTNSNDNNSNDTPPSEDESNDLELVPEVLDSTLNKENIINNDIYSIGTINSRTIALRRREAITQYYDSEAWQKYHDEYNFRYPGQDYSYRTNNDQNAIFTNKNNSSETINGYDVVMNERVINEKGQYVNANNEVVTEDTQKIKYNDADWIINEIQRGTFKKHRAADKMYLNDMSKINSVVKEFTISTSTRGDLTLGLYVPAGEVVEITFSDETWELIKNRKNAVSFVINQNMWNNYPKGDSGRISTRYPYIETSFGANAIKGQSFQIGSPFGGGLSIFINSNILKPGDIPLYSQIQDVSFTVSGAIPCLYYEDGITKRDEWFNQIKKVQENKLAPILQAWSPYFSLTIPFNGLNRIGGKDINTLIYPCILYTS